MAKVKTTSHAGKTQYYFHCPACDREHKINDSWDFDGDFENPTFHPSVLGKGKRPDEDGVWHEWVCHSFVKNGRIRFLNDCTHELAGQTVDLPEISE